MSDFGQRLRSAREVAGFDLHEAATAAGVNPWQLELAETGGKHDFMFRDVGHLAALYGVTLDWLSGRVDSPWEIWEPRPR